MSRDGNGGLEIKVKRKFNLNSGTLGYEIECDGHRIVANNDLAAWLHRRYVAAVAAGDAS